MTVYRRIGSQVFIFRFLSSTQSPEFNCFLFKTHKKLHQLTSDPLIYTAHQFQCHKCLHREEDKQLKVPFRSRGSMAPGYLSNRGKFTTRGQRSGSFRGDTWIKVRVSCCRNNTAQVGKWGHDFQRNDWGNEVNIRLFLSARVYCCCVKVITASLPPAASTNGTCTFITQQQQQTQLELSTAQRRAAAADWYSVYLSEQMRDSG